MGEKRNVCTGRTWFPTIVCVFPLPVAPYANTVAFVPRNTPAMSGNTVPAYTCSFDASPSYALSNTYRRSLFLTPAATSFLRVGFGSIQSNVGVEFKGVSWS